MKITDPYLAGLFLFANRKENETDALRAEFRDFEHGSVQHYTKYILGSWLLDIHLYRSFDQLKEGKKSIEIKKDECRLDNNLH